MGQLLFKKCFLDAIRAGAKRTTIRRWPAARLKPGERVFTPGVGWLLIESVDVVELSRLRAADARADGFKSVAALRRTLHELYPQAAANRDGQKWFRVAFKLELLASGRPSRPSKATRLRAESHPTEPSLLRTESHPTEPSLLRAESHPAGPSLLRAESHPAGPSLLRAESHPAEPSLFHTASRSSAASRARAACRAGTNSPAILHQQRLQLAAALRDAPKL